MKEYKIGQTLKDQYGDDIEIIGAYSNELFEYRFLDGNDNACRNFCNREYLESCNK